MARLSYIQKRKLGDKRGGREDKPHRAQRLGALHDTFG